MEDLMPMEQLREIAKAEAEIKEMSSIVQDTNKALQTKLNSKLAETIESDAEISKKISSTAEKLVDKGIEAQHNRVEEEIKRTEKAKNQAEFELAEDQYRAAGLLSAPTKKWQKALVEFMYDFWFVAIRIVCFFTLTPTYVFMNVIRAQSGVLKFVAILVGILILLTCGGAITHWVLKITQQIQI